MKSPLEVIYGNQKRFVTWRLETRKGKTTKLPYQLNGKLASSTDPKTWATYPEVAAKHEHIGIVLHNNLLLVLDLDHVIEGNEIIHAKKKEIDVLLTGANSFTEISQSGAGLHIYLALTEPLTLAHNKSEPAEAYVSGRYIATTGLPFGEMKPLRTVTPAEALALVEIMIPQGETPTLVDADDIPLETTPHSTATVLSDDQVLSRMFAAQGNGKKIKALYDGDLSQYKNDRSSADMALCSHLAFWTGKDAAQIERLWLASGLGQRPKTQKRADYRTRTIEAARAHCKEVYTPQPGTTTMQPGDPTLGLLFSINPLDKSKTYIQNTENVTRVLQRHPDFKDTLRSDAFRGQLERKVLLTSNGQKQWRNFTDTDILDIQTQISVLFTCFRKVGKDMVWDAISKVCKDNEYDSAADYLRALVWDKTPRLDSWLSTVFGTPNDNLHHKIGSNWVKGLVKRIIEPGCKFDYVLVLEGAQGIRKSTSLSILAGPLGHVETTMSTDNKDFFMQFQGNAIVEFSEGETLSRTEVKRMKALITIQSDKYRPPYGRTSVNNPRRCVFAMTTNQSEYLKDETGNRRWLPVAVMRTANTEWLEENRDQLYAEAYHRLVAEKETTYEFPEEEILAAQNARRIHDPNADGVVNWYADLPDEQKNEGVTVDQVFQYAMNGGFKSRPLTRYEEMSIADILKTVLMLDRRRAMIKRYRTMKWYPTEKTADAIGMPIAARQEF